MHSIKPQKTLVEQTYEILLNAICSGELQPGERLTQDEIAARLNVSRQPVNSAILAVQLAGQKMTDDYKLDADEILLKGEKALDQKNSKLLLQADVEFHELIYRWSGNHAIESSMRVNWQHIRRSMAEVLREPSTAVSSWEDHRRIINTLLAGEIELAILEMKNHIIRAQKKTMSVIGATN